MKNKTIKFIGVVFITTFILSYLSSTALVSAAEETSAFVLETSDSKNIGMGVIQSESPIASTLQINSNASGGFNYLDFKGDPKFITDESVLETENSELYYPVNLRYENFWNQDYLREFQTHYVRAQNVSDSIDQYGNYSVSLLTEQYSLSVDSSCEIFVSDLTSEVLFDAKSKGIYQIWYNDIGSFSLGIISPSDKIITPKFGVLPEAVDGGGEPLGRYFYFAAYETGTYRIYINTGDPIIKLRADYHKPQPIKFDEAINEGKDPSDPTFFDTVYSMNVYELDINDLETVNRYLLDFEFGSTGYLYYFIEDSLSTYPVVMSDGINEVLPAIKTGKIYIVIDNPEYFTWNSPGIDVANPQKYTMKFEQIEPSEHEIGDNETLNLAKSIGVTARTFEIVNTSLVSFHFENVSANYPNVFGNGNSYIQKIDEDEARYASMPSLISDINGTFTSALLEPGKYRVIFQHSGSMGPEYLHFYTKLVDLKTLNVEGMDLSGFSAPFTTLNFTNLDFEDVTLPAWEGYPNTYGATYPIGFNFSIDENFWDYGYNVSIHTDKNTDIFDDYITPDLAVLFETPNVFTDYTDAIQPGNATKVPIGDSNGDALIIGSYDKFDSVEITLADPSDRDAFTWQYFRPSSGGDPWFDFDISAHDFYDGTNTTTGSLNKSGTISWNPETIHTSWEFFSANSPDNGDETPDTDMQEYYLIRVLCTDDAADIANITSVRLRKFVKLNLDIVSKLAFNIGSTEEPVYYRASTDTSDNLKFASSYGQASYSDISHPIDKNYISDEAILYLYASEIQQHDYNGTEHWQNKYVPFEKPLTFSVCVFQPENYKRIIDYNISSNVPTTHSNQLNLSALTDDFQRTINIPDELTLYLNITAGTMFDWTQINVQFINASVQSAKLILPAMYDLNTAGIYTGAYDNGHFDLDLLLGDNMNASIEFGFITETVYLEFVITNTTDNAAIFKVLGGQFNYPMLTILAPPSGSNAGLFVGIGVGVVVLIGVSIFIYKKKNPV